MAMPAEFRDRRTARDDWARSQPPGKNSAVFFPGDELRCPCLLRGSNTERCGDTLHLWSGPAHQTIVRKRMALPWPTPAKALDAQCWKCRERLEIFPIPEAQG